MWPAKKKENGNSVETWRNIVILFLKKTTSFMTEKYIESFIVIIIIITVTTTVAIITYIFSYI